MILLLYILLLFAAGSGATTAGVTYSPNVPDLPPPQHIANCLNSLGISAVRLVDPTPAAVRAFSYTNISVVLSAPNYLVPSFAANRSAAELWLYNHVLPFHPRTRISLISVGSDVVSASISADPANALLPAIRNVHRSLRDLGIHSITVSTTFSFINIMSTAFPPSSAEFQEPINSLVIKPLLRFLDETNSSFLIDLYPYNIYKINSEIPVGFALFQELPFSFRDDIVTGVRYRNLFDMMVDAVIAAMAVAGQENIPVIVAATGWPQDEETENYAEMYLKGLVRHLKSGFGTPLRREGAAETYIYQLFDAENDGNDTVSRARIGGTGQHWGIMYPNLTMKYKIDFSGSERILGQVKSLAQIEFLLLVAILLLL